MEINTVYTTLVFFFQIDWNLALISYHNISTGIKHCLQNTVQGLFYFIFFKSEADLIKKKLLHQNSDVCVYPTQNSRACHFWPLSWHQKNTSCFPPPLLFFSFSLPLSILFVFHISARWCHCFFIFWSSETYLVHSILDQWFIEKHQMVLHHNNVWV